MSDIIPIRKGLSVEEHLEVLERLKRVMFLQEEVKVGKGKKAEIKKVFRWSEDSDDLIREKIINSIKHYRK